MFDSPNASPYVKDGFDSYLVHNRQNAVNPLQTGTKPAPHYQLSVEAGSSQIIRLLLSRTAPVEGSDNFADFDELFLSRIAEADAYFAALTPVAIKADTDRVNVMRPALAGMLWTKQYFYYDVDKWLKEHHISPEQRHRMRNGEWFHMLNDDDIISMPDKWEYPHKRQLKDSNVIPAGIAGIQMTWMARLTSTSICSGCRHKSVWN